MAGSARGQDEANPVFWLAKPERERWAYLDHMGFPAFPGEVKFFGVIFWPYNKSFIDQACSVKMAVYWPRSFFCVFMNLDFVSVHKKAKKELGQYPAILTSCLVNNAYILPLDEISYGKI